MFAAAGQPFAAILHFTCHPIPDFFGYAARLVEQAHPGLTCLPLNGCLGTVDTPFEVPLQGRTQSAQLPILGDALGHRTLELLARTETRTETGLGNATAPVFLPLAGVPGEPHVGFGRELEKLSPFAPTLAVSNVVRSCAYLLPEPSRARGGYEADPRQWGLVTRSGGGERGVGGAARPGGAGGAGGVARYSSTLYRCGSKALRTPSPIITPRSMTTNRARAG